MVVDVFTLTFYARTQQEGEGCTVNDQAIIFFVVLVVFVFDSFLMDVWMDGWTNGWMDGLMVG